MWIPEDQFELPDDAPTMLLYEVTTHPDAEPTRDQAAQAEDLHARSLEAAKRHGWFDFRRGLEDGYELMFADSEHYVNREYALDDRVLDPDRPEFLMYYETPRGPKLAGFMVLTRGPEDPGP